jgi:hypothetical protein
METVRCQGGGAFATPWPFVGIALLSILSSPITFGLSLLLGIGVGVVGALGGALSRSERGWSRGARTLVAGFALLAGPAAYLVLAVIVALVESA